MSIIKSLSEIKPIISLILILLQFVIDYIYLYNGFRAKKGYIQV